MQTRGGRDRAGCRRDLKVRASLVALVAAVLLITGGTASAASSRHDIAGTWQGTINAGPQMLRVVIQITRAKDGTLTATMYSIDQSPNPIRINSIKLDGANLSFSVDTAPGRYEGTVSADGASIAGTWTREAPRTLVLQRANERTAWPLDPSPHTVRFVTVDHDVKLEVLDFGGTGRPVVLLTGMGDNAHTYDKFAPKLVPAYRVYAITRRGYGASTAPATGYSADRLGDDVLEVLDQLSINRPVLVGHSLGGEELSSIGSRHPEKVAGLVYLDAAYGYAYYPAAHGDLVDVGDLNVDVNDLRKKLDALQSTLTGQAALAQELVTTDLPRFERDLQGVLKDAEVTPAALRAMQSGPQQPVAKAIMMGMQKYSQLTVPVLAFFAVPHDYPLLAGDPERAAFEARDEEKTEAQAAALERAVPSARVVRLAHANHYVYRFNEADVLREMNDFISTLPP
jgi:pimeloyl-ACP methyl ester carboxylesterase